MNTAVEVYGRDLWSCIEHICLFAVFVCISASSWICVADPYLPLFSVYLGRGCFLSNHLTLWLWDRLLIIIIRLCRGVASLGIFSIYVLIGQVDRKWWGVGRQ